MSSSDDSAPPPTSPSAGSASRSSASRRARIEHFEIPARRPEAAAVFFRRAFGWQVEPLPATFSGLLASGASSSATAAPEAPSPGRAPSEGPVYFTVRAAGAGPAGPLRGGLGTPEVVGADHPLLVVHVEGETLEACLARIEELGGAAEGEVRAVGEAAEPMGRYGRFRDPEGNLFGLWEPPA